MKSIFFPYHSTLNGKIHGQECWGFNTRDGIKLGTLFGKIVHLYTHLPEGIPQQTFFLNHIREKLTFYQ
ncbi:hypothetical protein P5673_011445 [Acropora cervicornis]|uniref:Uncharacterized protein n=1 Tax=Acropora cervicornis TaxID=6130 RepID=A0AAD9QNY7_ACRCE|nr:hypothetical protein P5673_011445 [Acropora cervicornis]